MQFDSRNSGLHEGRSKFAGAMLGAGEDQRLARRCAQVTHHLETMIGVDIEEVVSDGSVVNVIGDNFVSTRVVEIPANDFVDAAIEGG